MYRIPVYKVALVRDGSQAVPNKQIGCVKDAYDVLRPFIGLDADRERLVVLTLDTKNKAIGLNLVSQGDLNSTVATPREVFKLAVLQNACSLIIAHHHPSGNVEPSEDDLAISRRLDAAGKVLGIEVVDHMVLGEGGRYSSLKERGYFPCDNSLRDSGQGHFLLNSPPPPPQPNLSRPRLARPAGRRRPFPSP